METSKKHHFKIALAGAGLSLTAFAHSLGVTQSAVSHVLSGAIKSRKISREIDRFVKAQFKKLRLTPASENRRVS